MSDPKPKLKRRIMTNIEAMVMGNHLQAHCKPVPNTDFFQYEEGWDDERIALETAPDLNKEHARRFRLDLLGDLAPVVKGSSPVTYSDPRCALLIERFNELLEVLLTYEPGGLEFNKRVGALRISIDDLKGNRP
jgi:hypothetical protein